MTLSGILLGLINILIVVIILALIGAIAKWILSSLGWGPPTEVQRLYIALIAVIALYLLVALLFGLPGVRIIGGGETRPTIVSRSLPPIIAPERLTNSRD